MTSHLARFVPPSLQPASVGARALPPVPDPSSPEATFDRFVDHITGLNDAVRQGVTDALWSRIPQYVQEFASTETFGGAGSPTLDVPPEFDELVRVTTVVVSVPAGCVARLDLGGHIVPNLTGVVSLRVSRLLNGGSRRRLTCDNAGPGGAASLALYGEQVASMGNLAP